MKKINIWQTVFITILTVAIIAEFNIKSTLANDPQENTIKRLKKTVDDILIDLRLKSQALATEKFLSGLKITDELFKDPSLDKTYRLIKSKYITEATDEELIKGAIEGMLKALDKHSRYESKEEREEEITDTVKKEFAGIGAELSKKEDLVEIVNVIEKSPAEKVGLKTGDVIIKVNGEKIDNLSLSEVVRKIRGPIGTNVELEILRKSGLEPLKFIIKRDIIEIRSVKYKRLPNDIGYIKFSQFTEDSDKELDNAISNLKKEGCQKFIIDLRGNPGGFLNQAVKTASLFLGQEKEIVSIKGRKGTKTERFFSDNGKWSEIPILILVNEWSASASEIFAAAMKDHKRGLIVGTKTYGKGSVQGVFPFIDGSAIHLTIAKFYSPSGKIIDGEGVTPDVIAPLPKDICNPQVKNFKPGEPPKDPQLQKAIEILSK